MKNTTKQSGFTLVELAIVLVIIGLIVGGVLAGQDLIKAAEQRAAVGQIEKLDTVVNAFRGKYNGIPGDVQNPATFGFTLPGATTTQGNGTLDTPNGLDGEPAVFFAHLATASLINESITRNQAQATTTTMSTSIGDYAPISKLGKGIHVTAQSGGGVNYYMLDNSSIAATGVITPGYSAMSPIVAFNMDSKLDDGIPTTGKVMVAQTVGGTTTNVVTNDYTLCANNATTPTSYSTNTPTNADAGRCALRVKASF